MTIERMFLAVVPPPEIIDAISDLPTETQRGVRFTRRAQWHVTMRFLGDCERHEALAALAGLHAPSCQVHLGPEVMLMGTRVVMIPAVGLEEVALAVDEAFADIGEPSEREFVGHLTLARLKGAPLRDPSTVSMIGAPISPTFEAHEIALFKSELGAEGASHTLVATQELH